MERSTPLPLSLHEQVHRACKRTVRRLFITCLTCAVLGTLLIMLAR